MSFLRHDGIADQPKQGDGKVNWDEIALFNPPLPGAVVPPFIALASGQGFNLECVVGWNFIGDTDPAATSIVINVNAGSVLQQLKATGDEARALHDLLVTLSAYRVESGRWHLQQAYVTSSTDSGPNG